MANKNYDAWELVFATKRFDTSLDIHVITADEIKAITGREPRLMAKVDSSKELAPVLSRNGYFPLPIANGTYALVRGNGFHTLENITEMQHFHSRIMFNLEAMGSSTSEMQYLDYSHSAGVIEQIIGKGTLYPIIRGRVRSGNFSFNINNVHLDVSQAQIEIDLGLEGKDSIVLLEGKSKTPEDFIIRQLYYPYRKYNKVSPEKKIIPVFFTYDSKLKSYNYWVYKFIDDENYNSLSLIAQYSYSIDVTREIEIADIYTEDRKYNDITPQADDLDKVQQLIFKIKEGLNNSKEIANYFAFDKRQSSYYREAAEALGFVKLEHNSFHLTDNGLKLTSLSTIDRNLFFAQSVSSFKLVKLSLELLQSNGSVTRKDFEVLIKQNSNLTGATIIRRAQTLSSWFRWLAANTGAFKVDRSGTFKRR